MTYNILFFAIADDDYREAETLKLETNKHAANTAVAIAERMDCFKIQMEFSNLV